MRRRRCWRAELRVDADRLYAQSAVLLRAMRHLNDLADRAVLEAMRREICEQARRLDLEASRR